MRRRAFIRLTLAFAVLVRGLAAAAPRRGKEKLPVRYPSYERNEQTPVIEENVHGLRIRAGLKERKPVFRLKEPWPLFGAYRLGPDVISELGADVAPHLHLVVTNKQARGLYIFKGGILGEALTETPPSPAQPAGCFCVDLKTQCRITPERGKYWVVALVGNQASPVVAFEVK